MREPSPYFIYRNPRPESPAPVEPWPAFDQQEEALDLWKYWQTVRRHSRLIASIFLGAILLTGLRLSMMVPLYTAQTTVLIAPREPSIVESRAMDHGGGAQVQPDYFSTQLDILKSRSLAARVIRSQHLQAGGILTGSTGEPSLMTEFLDSVGLGGSSRQPSHPSVRIEPLRSESEVPPVKPWLVDAYLARLKITAIQDTSLAIIAFTSTDRAVSAAVANAHAREYIRQGIEIHSQANREAERFLQQKLVELKEQLEKSEIALNAYRRAKGIIPGLMSLNGKDAIVLDRLTDLSRDLTTARVARISLEAQLQLIHRKQYSSLPAVMNNSLIQGLESQLNDLYAQNASLSNQFKPDYPPVAQLQAKTKEVQDRLDAEVRRVVSGIESAYQEATENENRLQAEMDRQRSLTLSLNDAAVKYAILQREVDTNRELYESVLKAMKDVGVLAEAQTSNVSIIDRAEPPSGPSSPKPARDLLFAAVLGLVGAIGVAFALDYLDNTFKSPDEVEQYLRLPALAVVPEYSQRSGQIAGRNAGVNGSAKALPAKAEMEPSLCRELSTPQGYYSSLVEAYRNFRTALMLSRAGSPPKTTLITSAFPQEGKTVTAVNTAVMFAQLGNKVLLVDADLRRPRCHQFFALENQTGLSEVLTGAGSAEEMIRTTGTDHLYFLGAGSIPPNPTELLGSTKMAETLRALEALYDFIVIDSPPVMPVSDALLLSTLVDGVALVADGSQTPRQQVKAACTRLQYARAKILGIVLNKANAHSSYYTYYSGYYSADAGFAPDGEMDSAAHG